MSETHAEPSEPNEIADLLAPFWSAARTRLALGLSDEELAEECAAHRVLGVLPSDGESVHYPVFQFEKTKDGKTRVKPGLVAFMVAVGARDGWTIGILAMTPLDELDGQTPLDWLRSGGDPKRLETIGELIHAEWR